MFHIRHRKRRPRAGEIVMARCGERVAYTGTMWLVDNDQCCAECLALGLGSNEDSDDPKYIMPEKPEDVTDTKFWIPAS